MITQQRIRVVAVLAILCGGLALKPSRATASPALCSAAAAPKSACTGDEMDGEIQGWNDYCAGQSNMCTFTITSCTAYDYCPGEREVYSNGHCNPCGGEM